MQSPQSMSMPQSQALQPYAPPQHPPQPDRYQKIEKLGEGTYGVVYRAVDLQKKMEVALKKVRMDAWDEGVPATALREISVLKEVRHPNIVALDNVFVSRSGNLYLVFELVKWDLKHYLDHFRHTGLGLRLVKWLLFQLLSGIEACHASRTFHRDLKPQNILINDVNGSLKIADFGLARTFAIPLRPYTLEVITLWYRGPEILLGQPIYSTSIDIWSVGCIFAEMASGQPLFTGDSEIDQVFKIFRKLGTPTPAEWPSVQVLPDFNTSFPKFRKKPWSVIAPQLCDLGQDLLARMLTFDPVRRISAADALKHPFFADVAILDLTPPPPTMNRQQAIIK